MSFPLLPSFQMRQPKSLSYQIYLFLLLEHLLACANCKPCQLMKIK